MSILTVSETKTLLQVSDNSQDDLIGDLIPIIQDFVLDFCNTNFTIKNRYLQSGTIAFVSGTPATITDSEGQFLTAKFSNGIHLLISGSVDNDKIVEVDTVTADTVTLATGETLVSEDAGDIIFLQRVKFPAGLKHTVAKMIGFNLEKNVSKGVKGEKVGSYSVTYDNNYPENILTELRVHRKVGI